MRARSMWSSTTSGRQAGRPYAEQYRIKVIPTQVFLDSNGHEYFRHEGFFAREQLVEVLKRQGVK